MSIFSDVLRRSTLINTKDNLQLVEKMSAEDSTPKNLNPSKDKGNDKVKTLTYIEKFKKVSEVTQELNQAVRAHDTKKFLEYVEELKNFIKLVKQGKSVAVISRSSQSSKMKKRAKIT